MTDVGLIQVFRTFNASKTLQDQLDELTDGECPIPVPTSILIPMQAVFWLIHVSTIIYKSCTLSEGVMGMYHQ